MFENIFGVRIVGRNGLCLLQMFDTEPYDLKLSVKVDSNAVVVSYVDKYNTGRHKIFPMDLIEDIEIKENYKTAEES